MGDFFYFIFMWDWITFLTKMLGLPIPNSEKYTAREKVRVSF